MGTGEDDDDGEPKGDKEEGVSERERGAVAVPESILMGEEERRGDELVMGDSSKADDGEGSNPPPCVVLALLTLVPVVGGAVSVVVEVVGCSSDHSRNVLSPLPLAIR